MRYLLVLLLALGLAGCNREPPAYESRYTEPSSSTAGSASRPPFNVDTVSEALRGNQPYAIAVLGDSTGNQPNEWVHLMAQRIADTYGRQVTVNGWDDKTNTYGGSQVYGAGAPVTVWNASAAGKGADYSLNYFTQMTPEKVNLTIINHSHNGMDRSVPAIAKLVDRSYGNTVPGGGVAVTLQNPRIDQFAQRSQAAIDQLRNTYSDPATGVVLIDVNGAWQGRDLAPLLFPDGVHPTDAGELIWVDTVMSALRI